MGSVFRSKPAVEGFSGQYFFLIYGNTGVQKQVCCYADKAIAVRGEADFKISD